MKSWALYGAPPFYYSSNCPTIIIKKRYKNSSPYPCPTCTLLFFWFFPYPLHALYRTHTLDPTCGSLLTHVLPFLLVRILFLSGLLSGRIHNVHYMDKLRMVFYRYLLNEVEASNSLDVLHGLKKVVILCNMVVRYSDSLTICIVQQ